MDRQGQPVSADGDASKRNWKEDVEIAKEYAQYLQSLIKMLENI